MKINAKMIKPIILIVTAITLILMPSLKLPYLDKKAEIYFSETITKAGVTYGSCRIINASVSVIKESQIQIEPAGLGVTLAAGQVLDPLDDMTERASDIMTTAIISLGIQKIIYELGVNIAPSIIGIAIIIFIVAHFVPSDHSEVIKNLLLKTIIFISVARLCLPISALISSSLDESYFTPNIQKAQNELTMGSPELDRLKDMSMPEVDGVLNTMENGFKFVKDKTSDLGSALKATINNAGKMVDNLLKISYLYVALFIIQVIILPLGSFWLLVKLCNAIFGTNVSYIIKHKDLRQETNRQIKNA